ncbi:MAG TPA: hypothetical protein VF556_06960 [Pyrinomonadaceae bacterium]|jgi:hypothetical protein
MKLRKLLLVLAILFASFQADIGQEKNQAILLDEFGDVGCEEFWARIDALFAEINKDSQSKGYILIYGKENNLLKYLGYESMAYGIINFRNFNKGQIKVVRGTLDEDKNIQLWKVPFGAKTPEFIESNWSYKLSKSIKPFIFAAYTWGGICPTISYVKLFADFLKANPKARGHLVIRDKTNKNIKVEERKVLDELVNQYKIPHHRLKIFYVKDKEYPYGYTDVEFWFVP